MIEVRPLKLIGIVLGGLVALVAIALLGVRLFVNPNDYKDRIAKAVKDSSGRELSLPGEIKLSVFPWIALELGPVSLGNPPGFGAESFASVKHAALRVRVLPLLHRRLQIGRIDIDGLDLRLHKNAQGKGNWQGFGGSDQTSQRATSSGSETLGELGGVVIKDSRVSFEDIIVDHLNVDVGRVISGAATPVKLKLDLTSGPGAAPIALAGAFNFTPDMAREQYRFASLELDGTMGSKAGAPPLTWKFLAPDLSVNLAAQTMSAPSFSTQSAGAHLAGSVQGSFGAVPGFTGTFKLDPTSPRELLSGFGVAAPKTRDAKALSRLAASGEFAYGGNEISASKLDVQLDDSTLQGSAAINNLETKAMNFDLVLDHIDLDRYRSPDPTSPQPPAKAADSPTDSLKALRLNGKLAIGSVRITGVNLTQVHVSVVAKDGVTHIAPATAKLYGGDYSGDVTLDDRGAVPALKVDQSMTGIDVAPLLKDFANSQRISGRGNVTTALAAHGTGSTALMKSLSGHVAANLDNGAVEGVDLWFEINRAMALIQTHAVPSGQSSGRTKFDTFKASADLANGVASTKDLNIASQNLRVAGQGTANLVTEAIDYQVKATVLKDAPTAKGATDKTLAEIPLAITGTMTTPKVRPDLEGIAKARAQQELDKHKQELQQKVQDKLKDLFK